MHRQEVLNLLSAHREELRALGARTVAVFGSVARDEATADSDVDVLVEFAGRATFDAYVDLVLFLERLLGRRVDLVTRRALHPALRNRVEQEALYAPGLSPLPQ